MLTPSWCKITLTLKKQKPYFRYYEIKVLVLDAAAFMLSHLI